MRKDIASIVIGVAAMAVSFCPFIPIQLIGAVAAVVGFRLAREAAASATSSICSSFLSAPASTSAIR